MTEAVQSWAEETIPVLRVSDAKAAAAWYARLGFRQEWEHRFEPNFPVFTSLCRGADGSGIRLFLSEHSGDAVIGGLVYIRVTDVAPIAAEFDAPIVELDGRREVHLDDLDGNRLRVGSRSGTPDPRQYTQSTA